MCEEEIIMSKISLYSTGIHFSRLFCQPMTRNLNNNPFYECKRHVVQIKWYQIKIMFIMILLKILKWILNNSLFYCKNKKMC